MANERLPEFEPSTSAVSFPTPSMHIHGRRTSGDAENMDILIRKTLDDEEGDVARLAERIASGRKPLGRPKGLQRFETT
jgi:serine/threonine-protein phosphatase 2B catalytic subunit